MEFKSPSWVEKHRTRFFQTGETPSVVALGASIGIFFGFMPFFGLKTLLAILVTWILRGSKVAAAIAVSVHELALPVLPLLIRFEYDIGYWILSAPHEFPPGLQVHEFAFGAWMHWDTFLKLGTPTLIGATLIALPAALISYFVVYQTVLRRSKAKL